MSFSSPLAISVGDVSFDDRDAFSFLGDLDEFSDEGILLHRAQDSIIFSPDSAQTSAGSTAPEALGATMAMKLSQELVDDDAQNKEISPPHSNHSKQESDGDKDRFVAHPALMAALVAAGASAEQAHEIEQSARAGLEALAFNHALFSLRDFEKALGKAGLVSWISGAHWVPMRDALISALALVSLTPEAELAPNTMLALASFIALEDEMIELAQRDTDAHCIPNDLVDSVLNSKPTMSDEQKAAAIASCLSNKAVVVTEGAAGAGKSFTLNTIREIYEKAPASPSGGQQGYDIIGTALSWTATKVLEESAGLSGGRAIQGLVMAMEEARAKGGDFFKRRTLLIVDEAGLVGVKHMHKILWHASQSSHPVRVLLTGDSLQLCPVEAGNALEAIVDACGSSRLDTIRRQKQASHRAAVKHFCYGRAENGLWTYWQQEAIHFCADKEERRELVMRDYVRHCVSNPQEVALVLALENAEVKLLNSEIRERLKLVGRLMGDEHEMTVTDGHEAYKAAFCVGDQIVLRKNKVDHPVFKSAFETLFNGAAAAQRRGEIQATKGSFARMIQQWRNESPSRKRPEPRTEQEKAAREVEDKPLRLGIFNRTTGIIIDIKKNPDVANAFLLRILLAEGGEVEIDSSKYLDEKTGAVPLHHNFATTIYASQGQTVHKVLIMDSPYMNRRLAYVGMSRHTMLCDIYADCSEIDARVAKNGDRQVERAWKRFEKDTKSERGPEQLRLVKLRQVISEWECKPGAKASHYLRAMANSWNLDSANPTVFIAKKLLLKKRKAAASARDLGSPALAQEDDPDDHLEPRLSEPYLFHDLEMGAKANPVKPKGFLTQLAARKKPQVDEPSDMPAPLVVADHRETPGALPDWSSTERGHEALESTRGIFWGFNRHGYPRFFSVDASHAKPSSRWRFDGALKAGDGEPCVMVNQEVGKYAPWMIVAGPREALLSHAHYRKSHATEPRKIPNIVAAMPACDLSALSLWLLPGEATLHCAWSEKNPESLAWARQTAQRLRKLGHSATVHPPDPAPAPPASRPHHFRNNTA